MPRLCARLLITIVNLMAAELHTGRAPDPTIQPGLARCANKLAILIMPISWVNVVSSQNRTASTLPKPGKWQTSLMIPLNPSPDHSRHWIKLKQPCLLHTDMPTQSPFLLVHLQQGICPSKKLTNMRTLKGTSMSLPFAKDSLLIDKQLWFCCRHPTLILLSSSQFA